MWIVHSEGGYALFRREVHVQHLIILDLSDGVRRANLGDWQALMDLSVGCINAYDAGR